MATAALGFACRWDRQPENTWSGTPWLLRHELRKVTSVEDLPLGPPAAVRTALKALGTRRAAGQWRSLWKHSRAAQLWVERELALRAARARVDAVVQIQDLGATAAPYFLVQDLSYNLLLEHGGGDAVPHFRTLGRGRATELRDRQLGLYQRAAGLLPMSRWLAQDVLASGVAPERVTVVNPGVNVETPLDAPVPERRRTAARRLLLVGRDFDTKAGDQVVAAFRILRREMGPDASLTIMGPPAWPLRGEIPDGVDFRGPVARSDVAAAMDSHDLFVMPSRLEGFGIAFVEALVRGLPCIGRKACAMPEIIDEQSAGRLVTTESPEDLAELVFRTLQDDDLYEACAAAAPERRAHYTWRRAARQVVEATTAALGTVP